MTETEGSAGSAIKPKQIGWPKGVSGNPQGRPSLPPEIRALLHDRGGPAAVRKLVELIDHDDPKIALAAARDIADRTYGKAKESVEVSGGAHEALAVWLIGRRDEQEAVERGGDDTG